MFTEQNVVLAGHYRLWDRGDGIAEISDLRKSGTIIFFVHCDQQLDYDEHGDICELMSAFPGVITEGSLRGIHVNCEKQLDKLLKNMPG